VENEVAAKPIIAVLGGTGALGSGLARRWAKAGYSVILGSRDAVRAQATADEMNATLGVTGISGATYVDAAAKADIAAITVPFASQRDTLDLVASALAGKILIDCTAPLKPPKVGTVQLPPEGSAGQIAQGLVGPDVIVVSAFQDVGASLLHHDAPIECDVLVCSDNVDARKTVVTLVEAAGLRGIEAGPLANAAAAEALTSILITINRRYKADHAGIHITGLPETAFKAAKLKGLSFTPVSDFPHVNSGDDLAAIIVEAAKADHVSVSEGDVFIVAQKVVSKAAGLIVDLAGVVPSAKAIEIGKATEKDPRYVEVVLQESTEVIKQAPHVLLTQHVSGAIVANAGVDRSNVDPALGGEPVLLLPRDPDAAAATLREALSAAFGCEVAVIISDSWGRPWRVGTTGSALGVAGIDALHDYRGRADLFGRELQIAVEAVADELAGAANILMGQGAEGAPVVIAKGFTPTGKGGAAKDLLRPKDQDLYR
jgi:coenzyme F420-0:L-glutamate ligase/NADPH-dependent F420 reductase